MKNGDIVANKKNGIVGTVIKTYKPTGAEYQVLIKTLDGREYHALMSTWVKLRISVEELADLRQMLMSANGEAAERCLNPYGEYVLKFARNHGMSIDEAYKEPIVKARLKYFNDTGR